MFIRLVWILFVFNFKAFAADFVLMETDNPIQ